ncbi:MAG: serine/threonine-protein kinase [Acidobacteriota bacterium]
MVRKSKSSMTPERWQRVTALLEELMPCAPEAREKILARECGDDVELRREVESLLDYEDQCVSVLDQPLASPAPSDLETWPVGTPGPEPDEVGMRIGPYRILERLGEGGMGTVYLAAREDDFQIQVALKQINRETLRDGALSRELLYRFENERQILADLAHPNIARILDAGTTPEGLPYFTMDYVDGKPIDIYCDRHRLTVRQRIELVLQVCSALQTAHQNLVVHRDLKPSNILVTAGGIPKLIDFGIAKPLEPAAAPHDLTTRTGSMPMTFKYASPEQFKRQTITTATDIYSLGVLVYQLLTGHDPYPFDQGILAMHRSICEHEPFRPSIAVERSVDVESIGGRDGRRNPRSVSRSRSSSPEKLRQAIAGDLDSILLKALRKRPENRYRSVEHFADDLQRYLNGLPVHAREGTARYVAGKFLRRHKGTILRASVMILTLAIAVGAYLRREADLVEIARSRAARTADLVVDVIDVLGPDEQATRVTPLGFVDITRRLITEDLEGTDPERLADFLGGFVRQAYLRLGHLEHALDALKESLEILQTFHSGDHPKIADNLVNQGALFIRLGDFDQAMESTRAGLEMRRRLGLTQAADLSGPLGNLASTHYQRGEYDRAAALYRQALALLAQELGPRSHPSARHLRNLGMTFFVQGRLSAAREKLQESLSIELEHRSQESSRVAGLRSTLGRILHAEGRYEEAERELLKSVRVRRLLDAQPFVIARAERNLALVMIARDEKEIARVLLDRVQLAFGSAESVAKWEIAEVESLIGELLVADLDFEEAEPCLLASYMTIEAARGPGSVYTKQALQRVIELYEQWGRSEEAAEYRAWL